MAGRIFRQLLIQERRGHLNRVVKTAIGGLGANKTEGSTKRVGKWCVGKFIKIMDAYDEQAGVASFSGTYNKSFFNYLYEVIRQLLGGAHVFYTSTSHNSFLKLKPNIINTLSQKT